MCIPFCYLYLQVFLRPKRGTVGDSDEARRAHKNAQRRRCVYSQLRGEQNLTHDRNRASKPKELRIKYYNDDTMKARLERDEIMQARYLHRRQESNAARSTPPPTLVTLPAKPLFFGLPPRLTIRLDVHRDLSTLLFGLETLLRSVSCHLGFDSWSSIGNTFDSVRLSSAERWGNDEVHASTFMHLQRLEFRRRLVDKGEFVAIRHVQGLWRSVIKTLLPMAAELDRIVKRCRASSVDGENLAVSVLELHVRDWHNLASLATAMAIVLEDEINSWCAAGQWTKGSSSSIQVALHDVCTFSLLVFIDACLTRIILQLVKDGVLNKQFVSVSGRDSTTVQRLMPGEWVSGDVFNFFIDQWQPDILDGIILFRTTFSTLR